MKGKDRHSSFSHRVRRAISFERKDALLSKQMQSFPHICRSQQRAKREEKQQQQQKRLKEIVNIILEILLA